MSKGGMGMYFSLFDKLCKNEFSHADIERVQEDLKEKLYSVSETDKNIKAQA